MESFEPREIEKKIPKNLVLDVDGVMTDGRFYYTAEGKAMKVFGPDDADALSILKKKMNIVFISGDKRGFPITKKRIEDMKFPIEQVSTFDRLNWINKRFDPAETIYMGDGIYDSFVFDGVFYGIAPDNAFHLTKEKADFVTKNKGGHGAVAEAVCHILERFFEPLELDKIDFSSGSGAWGGDKVENNNFPVGKLGIGPMSPEIIEAVFRYSDKKSTPLMLIASKNQIDWDGGYVNGWNTAEYMDYVNELKVKYPANQVKICRDHCGPGFKNHSLEDVYKTLEDDINLGFDLLHIDFCKYQGSYEDILRETEKAIRFVRGKNSDILIEVGTDENKGEQLNDLERVERELKLFTSISPVSFYVCQTGSLVKEINQVGIFNKDFVEKLKNLTEKFGVLLKEHNCDYLPAEEIALRKNLVGAVNVAPQFGTIQTMLTIKKAVTYGIDFSKFFDQSYASRRWEKWLHKNDANNKFLCSVIAGHYNFNTESYKELYDRINKHEDFREEIISEIMKNIDLYINNL